MASNRSCDFPIPAVALPAALLILSLALIGCGSRTVGYGVLLWSPDESMLESGSVVTVQSQSDLTDTYTISAAELEEPTEIARWRLEFYEEEASARGAATEYEAAFEGTTTLYARATRNALPIRSDAQADASNTVYRLREGEEIKLVGRQPDETDQGGLVSFWYEALTRTGERGWVFGHTLEIYDPTDPSVVVGSGGSVDPLIELLLNNVWRPIYFVDMISNDAIDLDLFRPEYGLFPEPERNQLELVLPSHATIFEYEEIVRVGPRRYLARGTSLQLTFQRNDELSLQYTLDGRQHILALQRVPDGIEEYVEAEVERRETVYEELIDRGPGFRSDNYGELAFLDDRRFTWTGYGRLVPQAIPDGAGESGTVDLNLFLSTRLLGEFDGALSFRFEGADEPTSFLYALRDNGIRLVWVPQEEIDERLVQRQTSSPLVIFMSSTGG
ncbi:MAG: SH3 domain-containing protein [Spirochaetota bacterium]